MTPPESPARTGAWPGVPVWVWRTEDPDAPAPLLATLDPDEEVDACEVEVPHKPSKLDGYLGVIERAERLVRGEATGAWPELPVWIWTDETDQVWVSAQRVAGVHSTLLDVPRDAATRSALRGALLSALLRATGTTTLAAARAKLAAGKKHAVTARIQQREAPSRGGTGQPTTRPNKTKKMKQVRVPQAKNAPYGAKVRPFGNMVGNHVHVVRGGAPG